MNYFGLIQSAWTLLSIGITLGWGTGIVPFGAGGVFSDWNKRNMTAVFAAAPLSMSRVHPVNVQSTQRKLPPAYSKTTSVNVHFSQFNPSNCCATPFSPTSVTAIPNGGTEGANPGASTKRVPDEGRGDGDCARVDVWFPKKGHK